VQFYAKAADHAIIPAESTNIDWQEYQAWLAEGNEPLPYVPPVVVEPTNWPGFVIAIQNDVDFKTVWGAANTADPLAAQSLLVAFNHVANGGLATFAPLYNAVCALGGASPTQREAWATLAEGYHAPAEFVDAMRG